MYGTKRRKRGSSEESEDIDVEESEEEEAEYDGDEGEDDEDDFDEMFAEPTQPAVMVNVDQGNRYAASAMFSSRGSRACRRDSASLNQRPRIQPSLGLQARHAHQEAHRRGG
jgi:hypothetical protein